ncbi:glycosyltransferase family 2 protein [Photobacterium carnosum]|uniref:glycosyltransferase family 2 protein n=1 Tax=Photobacterium carnosum TaxID=2023717 RepID=UPI001E5D42D0|nr:glycosyltransferase family 2 protein [Photobacterium carnosum]MCD9557548.1 glycosyltransferase family 2 protein [Photobacterium carnosum]
MEKIYSIIVTFNPELSIFKKLIQSLSKQKCYIYVIDNNSFNLQNIKEVVDNYGEVFEFLSNEGIAKAQNYGIRKALSDNAEFLLLLDQDSNIDDKFLSSMLNKYQMMNRKNDTVIGPLFYDSRYGFEYPQIVFNQYGLRTKILASKNKVNEVSLLISSGMFMHKDVFINIGEFDEKLFIDYVDSEWCFRARNGGVKFYVYSDIVMYHEIGSDNIKLFKWRIPVHNPARRYYRIRNALYLFKYPHINKIISLRETIFSICHQLILIFIYKDKMKNTKVLFSAVWSGLKGLLRK